MNRLTVREACEQLRCSRWTLDRLFKAGKLHKITHGRSVYVDAAEVARYIDRNGTVRTATAVNPDWTPDELAALKVLAQQMVDASKQRVA